MASALVDLLRVDVRAADRVEPVALAAVLAGRLRDRRLIDGPARLAVGAARWSYSHADEDGFFFSFFRLLRLLGGGRHGALDVLLLLFAATTN